MMKTIKLDDAEAWGCGSNGHYFKYDETTGLKITPRAKSEGIWLKWINSTLKGLFPEFKGYCRVKWRGGIYNGYFMEHINGEEWNDYIDDLSEVAPELAIKLESLGIYWRDCHEGNIIVEKSGKIRFIDADPKYFDVNKDLLDKLPKSVRLVLKQRRGGHNETI